MSPLFPRNCSLKHIGTAKANRFNADVFNLQTLPLSGVFTLLDNLQRALVITAGFGCIVITALNVAFLIWIMLKQNESNMARCPRCKRKIICTQCSGDSNQNLFADEENS